MSDDKEQVTEDKAQDIQQAGQVVNPNHTTAAHFSIFKEECDYWIKKLGLLGYKVFYLHKDRDKDDEDGKPRGFANYNASVIGRNAVLCLSVNWDDEGLQEQQDGSKITEDKIRQSAFHEVWELLLHRLFHIASNRAYTEFDFEEEKHNIIRTMENVVWAEDWGKRHRNSIFEKLVHDKLRPFQEFVNRAAASDKLKYNPSLRRQDRDVRRRVVRMDENGIITLNTRRIPDCKKIVLIGGRGIAGIAHRGDSIEIFLKKSKDANVSGQSLM